MRQIIFNELEKVYGKTIYNDVLADDIVKLVEGDEGFHRGESNREDRIRLRIWDFYSGGDTAQHVANEIKAQLEEAGEW